MCGSDAVPAIMHSVSVMNRQLSIAVVPAAACGTVSALNPATFSTGINTPTWCSFSSSPSRATASPYASCGMMPNPSWFDIQITGTR